MHPAVHAIIKQSGMQWGELWVSSLGVLVCLLGLSSRPAPGRSRVRPIRGREVQWQQHSDEQVLASYAVSPQVSPQSNLPAGGSRVVAAIAISQLRAEDAGEPAGLNAAKPAVAASIHSWKRPPPPLV